MSSAKSIEGWTGELHAITPTDRPHGDGYARLQYTAGLALALSGDGYRSQMLADDLERRFPEDTFVKYTYAPVLRGLSAMEHRKLAEAVERLHTALPYERAVNGLNFINFCLGGLH